MEKRAFTLVEIIVVFVLISLVATAAGISFLKMREEELFFEGVREVQNEIVLAQEVMLLQNRPISLTFSKRDDHLVLSIKESSEREVLLRGIKEFKIEQKNGETTTLTFSPFETEVPTGSLTLSNGKEERGFLFHGRVEYPRLHTPPYPKEIRSSYDAEYPASLSSS